MTIRLSCLIALALSFGAIAGSEEQAVKIMGRGVGSFAYYQWFENCLAKLEEDLPKTIESAQAAAKKFVLEDYRIAIMGQVSFIVEAHGRAGGLMRIGDFYDEDIPGTKYIILYAIREEKLEQELRRIGQLRRQGNMVIVFTSSSLLIKAPMPIPKFDYLIENHAAPNGGLSQTANGEWMIATDPLANVSALWLWTGEFISACINLGKMPTVWQSIRVPGALPRNAKIKGKKFDSSYLQTKVEPGQFAKEYLFKLRNNLKQIYEDEMDNIRAVGDMASDVSRRGGKLYTFVHNHLLIHRQNCPGDPGYFEKINKGWFRKRNEVKLTSRDLVFCVGYDRLYRGEGFGEFTAEAREAGTALVWCITDYYEKEIEAVEPGEILINQPWSFGDAVVPVPGCDVNILPTSGVLSELIYWMTNAEILQRSSRQRSDE